MKNNFKYIAAVAIISLIFLVLQWIFVVPANPFIIESFPFFLLYFTAIGMAVFLINIGKDYSLFFNSYGAHIEIDKKKYIAPALCLIVPFVIFLISNIISSPFFTWGILKNQIGDIKERKFAEDFKEQDIHSVPVVDDRLAIKLAEKKLGERPELVSQVKVTTPTIQLYKNKLVWVLPLEHSGFFKWLSNMSGTPGYIIVSATDQKDVEFVGNHKIKYQKEAYLLDNLKRKAQYKDLFSGLVDYSFELDEEGVPHWVVTTYQNKFMFGIREATGAVIVNATTGEAKKYSIKNIPEWVDRVQPEEFIMQQINNNGRYIKGIFNFSQSNMYRTSPGYSIIYNNGKCYLFTGITSVSNDDGAIAFYLVDMKDKTTYKYMMSGATENAAAASAEGKVQHLGYKASNPIILNIEGVPTYFMTLRDKEDLIKQYALVNIEDYTTVGNGETKEEALVSYKKHIRNLISENTEVNKEDIKNINGTVKRITSEINNGNVVYKFILNEVSNKVFEVSTKLNEYISLTKEGDIVNIEYLETKNVIEKVLKFKNTTLNK